MAVRRACAISWLLLAVVPGCYSQTPSARNSAATVANSAIALADDAQRLLAADPGLVLPTLLASESIERLPLFDNDRILRTALSLTPKNLWTAPTIGNIRTIAFGPDGRLIAAAGEDNAVHAFSVATGKEVWRVTEPD
jgi:type II secretory pathway pseudopilin PulG